MSEKKIYTTDMLNVLLKETVSEKRYIHSIGVAETTQWLLKHFNCKNYEESWNGFDAGTFCGLIHDLSREYSDEQWLSFCREKGIELDEDSLAFPVLAHGIVSASLAKELVGDYPQSWFRAVQIHTVGDADMDDLALALFIADFTEPSRVFLNDEKRKQYYSNPDIYSCAYQVLCDMMEHWKTKTNFQNAAASVRMKEALEKKLKK